MISAKEARERVQTALDEYTKKQMKEVEAYVENAIGNQEFMCTVPYRVTDEAKKKLEELGYHVKTLVSKAEDSTTEISW